MSESIWFGVARLVVGALILLPARPLANTPGKRGVYPKKGGPEQTRALYIGLVILGIYFVGAGIVGLLMFLVGR